MMEPLIFFLWMLAALTGGVYCLLKGSAVCRDWWSGSLEWEAAWPDLLLFEVLFLFAFICFVVLLRSLAVGQEGAGGSRWVTVPLYLFWGQLCAVPAGQSENCRMPRCSHVDVCSFLLCVRCGLQCSFHRLFLPQSKEKE